MAEVSQGRVAEGGEGNGDRADGGGHGRHFRGLISE